MIITLSGEYHGFPPSTPQQAEEFMVAVANAESIHAINEIKAVTNKGPLVMEKKP